MRILASNPDTIGDVVLRQPMYQALLDAGHELMLLARPLLAPVMGSIAPGARVRPIDVNLYDPRLKAWDYALDRTVEAAREFAPDVFLVCPYQWTALSERLSVELDYARVVAMTGRLFFDPAYGPAPESILRTTESVQVSEDVPEVRKNELLAGAVLGRAMQLSDPRITAGDDHLAAADAVLARLGLEAGEYWIACIGDAHWTRVRNWDPARWAALLSQWAARHNRKFLLVGQSNEMETASAIRELMGPMSGAAALWAGNNDGDLDVLLGLLARSGGYVGRDTGPMHLAAALGKRVLAVFGGGTWPRFLPQCDQSVSITVGVPCIGCNWICHLPRSYCIKEVPLEDCLAAADELEGGAVGQRSVRVIKPDAMLLARIGREGAASGRGHLTQLSVTRRELMEQTKSLTDTLERTAKQAGRAEALADELEATRNEMVRRESVMRQRLAAAETMFFAREAEMLKRIAELEAIAGGVEEQVRQRLEAIRPAMEAEIRHAIATEEAERTQREGDLRARFTRAQSELSRAQSELADLRLHVERMQQDRGTLATLTRQQEEELNLSRQRLHELMASRWRRYGQRLHLCMTMPWEREVLGSQNGSLNGKH